MIQEIALGPTHPSLFDLSKGHPTYFVEVRDQYPDLLDLRHGLRVAFLQT